MDVISALSGSGPAYVYVMISALADGAVKCGLPRKLAQNLATNMIHGASKMVLESGKHTEQVRYIKNNIGILRSIILRVCAFFDSHRRPWSCIFRN